jgi:hypothetical protein
VQNGRCRVGQTIVQSTKCVGHPIPSCVQPKIVGVGAPTACCCTPPPPGWQAALTPQAMPLGQPNCDGHSIPLNGGHCGAPGVNGQSGVWTGHSGPKRVQSIGARDGHCAPMCVHAT